MTKNNKIILITVFLATIIIMAAFWQRQNNLIKDVALPPQTATSIAKPQPPSAAPAASSPQGSEAAIITDKQTYAPGESINITIKNISANSIYFVNYNHPELIIWNIEKLSDGKWSNLDYFRLPITENSQKKCISALYERPVGFVDEIKSNKDILIVWDRLVCLLDGSQKKIEGGPEGYDPKLIDSGRYRLNFRYGLGAVKTADLENKPWEMPLTITGERTIYSSEFEIK